MPRTVRIAERLPGPTLKSYALCKLATDPVYQTVAERLLPSGLPLLDIGCGIGLLGFYLRELGYHGPILGVDPDRRKIKAGQTAEQRRLKRRGNQRLAEPPVIDGDFEFRVQSGDDSAVFETWAAGPGHVLMLDVLHYFDPATQHTLVRRMAGATAPGGWCILRLTPASESWRYTATRGLETFSRTIGWMSRPAQHFPTIASVRDPFEQAGFEAEVRPLWGRTPFNGYLFAFHKPANPRADVSPS